MCYKCVLLNGLSNPIFPLCKLRHDKNYDVEIMTIACAYVDELGREVISSAFSAIAIECSRRF